MIPKVLAGPVGAQDRIDFDPVFRETAAQVKVTTKAAGDETRRLAMPGGVILTCSDAGCVGMDMGAKGAVGCVCSPAMALRAVAEVCGMPAQARAELGVVHARLTVFAAGNAVPPRGVEALEPQHDDLVRQCRDKASGIGPKACAGARPAPGSDVSVMIGAPVAPAKGVGFDIDRLLATPRLPVMTPCL